MGSPAARAQGPVLGKGVPLPPELGKRTEFGILKAHLSSISAIHPVQGHNFAVAPSVSLSLDKVYILQSPYQSPSNTWVVAVDATGEGGKVFPGKRGKMQGKTFSRSPFGWSVGEEGELWGGAPKREEGQVMEGLRPFLALSLSAASLSL